MKKLTCLSLLFFCAACSTEEIKWVALGDSITYLNDHADETGNRITKGYMTRVAEKLPHVKYINKGFNGWTAVEVAMEIDKLDLTKADLYTVFLGTNDWWRGNPLGTLEDYKGNTGAETFYGAYRIITDKLRGLNRQARIILITPMQRVDFVYLSDMKNNAYGSYKEKNNQSLAEFADAVLAICKHEHFLVVDLYNESGMTHENLVRFKRLRDPRSGAYKNYGYPEFRDIPFNPETDEYPYPADAIHMTYDGLHPSDEGYEVIANMLVDTINK
jgi:lysophospholipase L1-like esterase